ncbi:hypothetical protein F4818DRAFT_452314, partial [Hypoxylon cercidicola]
SPPYPSSPCPRPPSDYPQTAASVREAAAPRPSRATSGTRTRRPQAGARGCPARRSRARPTCACSAAGPASDPPRSRRWAASSRCRRRRRRRPGGLGVRDSRWCAAARAWRGPETPAGLEMAAAAGARALPSLRRPRRPPLVATRSGRVLRLRVGDPRSRTECRRMTGSGALSEWGRHPAGGPGWDAGVAKVGGCRGLRRWRSRWTSRWTRQSDVSASPTWLPIALSAS